MLCFPRLLLAAPGADLFDHSPVRHLRIEIAPEQIAELRKNPRQYVPATIRDGTNFYHQVGIHLKGSTGSFRSLDDKPALTLNFGKFVSAQKFHGLQKIHLNNSVEDLSYVNEALGSELFRAAGVPAPRVAHALVELNGRRLGLYVLKEGFTKDFLSLYFSNASGNLYEPGPGHDVDEALRTASGNEPAGQQDLKLLAAAAREPDLARRWQRLEQALDMEKFISFMATEVMIAHRDGYCLARNNFRIYHDLQSNKLLFLPHGMDQLFGMAPSHILPRMSGLLARAVMEIPEGRRRYRERLGFLVTNCFNVAMLQNEAESFRKRLRPSLPRSEASALDQEVEAVKKRLFERKARLEKELHAPETTPIKFDQFDHETPDHQI